MRAIALLTTRNEARFITGCLRHLIHQGLEVHLSDDGSTDGTPDLARPFLGNGLLEIRSLPPDPSYRWTWLLSLKEELAATLEADWFMHADADEIRLPDPAHPTLRDVFEEAGRQGFNAVNFQEYTFVPTREHPDHDHPRFRETLLHYYPFLPSFPHRLTAWRKQPARVELAWSAGHRVRFPGLRLYPVSLPLKHYLFLSVPHAVEKFVDRKYRPEEVEHGWHGWRAHLRPEDIRLPPESMLRRFVSDAALDPSNPRSTHILENT